LGSIASSRAASCGFELIFCAMGLRRSLCEPVVVPVVESVVVEPVVVEPVVVVDPVVVDPVVVDPVFAALCGLPCVFGPDVAVDVVVVVVVVFGPPCVFGAVVGDEVIVRVVSCFGPELGAPCVVVTVCGFPRVEFPPPRPFASAGENERTRNAVAADETVRSRIRASGQLRSATVVPREKAL